jgi:hypothetical protein
MEQRAGGRNYRREKWVEQRFSAASHLLLRLGFGRRGASIYRSKPEVLLFTAASQWNSNGAGKRKNEAQARAVGDSRERLKLRRTGTLVEDIGAAEGTSCIGCDGRCLWHFSVLAALAQRG